MCSAAVLALPPGFRVDGCSGEEGVPRLVQSLAETALRVQGDAAARSAADAAAAVLNKARAGRPLEPFCSCSLGIWCITPGPGESNKQAITGDFAEKPRNSQVLRMCRPVSGAG